MRAARSTNVNLEEWSLSLLGTSRRESLAVEGTLPRVRPAPTRERSSVSSQTGRSGERAVSQHRTDERRGSQATDPYRAQSRPRPVGDSSDYGYERRGSRPINGD